MANSLNICVLCKRNGKSGAHILIHCIFKNYFLSRISFKVMLGSLVNLFSNDMVSSWVLVIRAPGLGSYMEYVGELGMKETENFLRLCRSPLEVVESICFEWLLRLLLPINRCHILDLIRYWPSCLFPSYIPLCDV